MLGSDVAAIGINSLEHNLTSVRYECYDVLHYIRFLDGWIDRKHQLGFL